MPLSTAGAGRPPDVRRPRVTAIVSAYNSARFMAGRLDNLFSQTLHPRGDLEIIVIDSNSPQDERSIVDAFQARYPGIHYVRTEHRETVYAAWNRGIALATGEHVINANSDDRFAPDALERLADELDRDPGIDVVYGDWIVTKVENDSFDSDTAKYHFGYPEFCPPILLYFQITTHAALIRASCFDRIGLFDPSFKVFGDREWMLRFAVAGGQARHVPEIVGLYLESPTSVERATPGALEEGLELRNAYLEPERLTRLLGWPERPRSDRDMARCLAELGTYGKHCARLDGKPTNQFTFSEICFDRALVLDPLEPTALNNLGVIRAMYGDFLRAIELFGRAMPSDEQGEIASNLQLARSRFRDLSQYHWRDAGSPGFRDRFHVVLAARDADLLLEMCLAYMSAFSEEEPSVLTVLAGLDLDHVASRLMARLDDMGLDPERTPDIRIVPGPALASDWPVFLEVADLVIGDDQTLERARQHGRRILRVVSPESLRAARTSE